MAGPSIAVRWAFVGGVLALAAGSYALGRAGDGSTNATPTAPPTAPPASGLVEHHGTVPDGGSFYYARTASNLDLPSAIDGALFSDRVGECVNACPIGMRVREGPEAAKQGLTALNSVGAALDALADAADATDAEFAGVLRAVRTRHREWSSEASPRARRVFSVGMPRPDYGSAAAMIVFGVYDHCDPIFDANRAEGCADGGTHVLVGRIERATDAGRSMVAGVVEVEDRSVNAGDATPAGAGPEAIPVMSVVAPIYMHFGAGRRGRVRGLFLDPNGHLFAFGADRAPHPLPTSPALVAALIAILRRA